MTAMSLVRAFLNEGLLFTRVFTSRACPFVVRPSGRSSYGVIRSRNNSDTNFRLKAGLRTAAQRFRTRTILHPDHELQPGPDLIYRADFDVNESGIETRVTHYVVRQICYHTRSLLRPRDPEHPRRRELRLQSREIGAQVRSRFCKEQNQLQIILETGHKRNSLGQFDQIASKSDGRNDERNAKAFLYPKLLCQRSS